MRVNPRRIFIVLFVNGAKTILVFLKVSAQETAKANGLEPYAYLRAVLTRLPHCETVEDIEKLLPENIELAAI